MVSFSQMRKATYLRPGVHLAPIAAVLWLIASCVDLTPPWDKPDAKRASGGAGTGGNSLTTLASGGATGGTTDSSSTSGGGSSDPIDAPVGGTSYPGSSSAGSTGKDAGIDQPGTGGTGGEPDAGPDVPQSGTGGTGGKQDASVGGTSSTAGAVAGSSGGSVTGGATGGSSKSGGAGGSSSTLPDGGGDTPDASPLLTGLVVYYRFETANGTVVQDSSGNGYDGTLSIGQALDGGTAPTATGYEYVSSGKVGKALALHKAGLGYVRVPPAVFANATDLTIAIWVNLAAEQSWQRILDVGVTPNPYQFGNSSTGTKYFNIVPKGAGGTSGNMLFSISSNGYSNEQTLSATSIPAGTWTHITVVLASGGGARLYINGAESLNNPAVTLRPKDLGTIDYAFIGKSRFDADPSFDGMVDCFRVYNRALPASEVQALYNYTAGH